MYLNFRKLAAGLQGLARAGGTFNVGGTQMQHAPAQLGAAKPLPSVNLGGIPGQMTPAGVNSAMQPAVAKPLPEVNLGGVPGQMTPAGVNNAMQPAAMKPLPSLNLGGIQGQMTPAGVNATAQPGSVKQSEANFRKLAKSAALDLRTVRAYGLQPGQEQALASILASTARARDAAEVPLGAPEDNLKFQLGLLQALERKDPKFTDWRRLAVDPPERVTARGQRRWLGLLPGKELPLPEGSLINLNHYRDDDFYDYDQDGRPNTAPPLRNQVFESLTSPPNENYQAVLENLRSRHKPQEKQAAPAWAKRWGSLSPTSRSRIVGSLQPGQMRTLVGEGNKGYLGGGGFNHAWATAGKLPTGDAGEFVRKLPVAGGNAMQDMYPGMMESSKQLAQQYPGRIAEYKHFDPQKGIYQEMVRGRQLPKALKETWNPYTKDQTGPQQNFVQRYFPGQAGGSLNDVRASNMLLQPNAKGQLQPKLFDWMQERDGQLPVGANLNTPLLAGHELPGLRKRFTAHPDQRSLGARYTERLLDGQTPSEALGKLPPGYLGTDRQRAAASARYYLGKRLPPAQGSPFPEGVASYGSPSSGIGTPLLGPAPKSPQVLAATNPFQR